MDSSSENTADGPVIATLVITENPAEGESALPPGGTSGMSADGGSGEIVADVEKGEPRFVQLREGVTFRIGRAKTNDYPIANRNVSRFHAVFSASASGVVLSDLSSLNGTMVNGARINTPVDISSGDVITIGDSTITVKLSLGECGESDSAHGRTQTAQLAAVVVTVLVVDVCGYTKVSEALPPKDVAEMMHLWFQKVAAIVGEYNGSVDKYIGDCVMALWKGKHTTAKEFTNKAVEAGIAIREMTNELSESGEWIHHSTFPWRCRVALNTGEALMGTVGGAGKRDFTVLGDTVNVAFRLEGVAGDMNTDFIFSNATSELISDRFPVEPLGEVNVAGRTGEISVYKLGVS